MAEKTIIVEGGFMRARGPYDQTYTVPGDVPGPSNVTLPGGATYTQDELKVVLNGQPLARVEDWNTVGVVPRTDVSIIQDLKAGDLLRFIKVHNP